MFADLGGIDVILKLVEFFLNKAVVSVTRLVVFDTFFDPQFGLLIPFGFICCLGEPV